MAEPWKKYQTDSGKGPWSKYQEPSEPETTVSSGLGALARGLTIPATGAAIGGALAGPPGAIAGSLALPAAELVSKGLGTIGIETGSPYELAQRGLTKLGFPEPQTMTERALQTGGEALGGVGGQLGALSRLATTATSPVTRNIAQQLSTLPERQLLASAPAGAVAGAVTEATDSPVAGTIAGVATSLPFGIRAPRQAERAPTIEQLKQQASNLYTEAKNAGVVIKKDPFKSFVNQLESDLSDMGIDPDIQPAAYKVLQRFKQASSKNNSLQDLEKLRQKAGGAAGSLNKSERAMAMQMKNRLDDFIEEIDYNQMAAGTKEGIEALKNARQAYKMSAKAEILDDIFNSAELRAEANFSQSGMENVLRRKLVNLADSKKQMRFFTKEEQQAIQEAAKGGTIQNFYRRLGKYAATSPIPTGIGAGLGGAIGTAVGGPLGGFIGAGAVPLAGSIARGRATDIGIRNFRQLEDMLRLGRAPRTVPSTRQILGTRGGLIGLERGILNPLEQE